MAEKTPPEHVYRDYAHAVDHVRRFYELNHRYQTVEFARGKCDEYARLDKTRMGI